MKSYSNVTIQTARMIEDLARKHILTSDYVADCRWLDSHAKYIADKIAKMEKAGLKGLDFCIDEYYDCLDEFQATLTIRNCHVCNRDAIDLAIQHLINREIDNTF